MLRGLQKIARGRTSFAAVANTLVLRVVTLGLNLFTGVISARSLGPEGRGISVAILLWPFIVAVLAQVGLPAAFTYHARKHLEECDRLFTAAMLIATITGCCGALIAAFLIIPTALHNYSSGTRFFAQWIMLIVPQVVAFTLIQAYLDVRGRFAQSNLVVALNTAATLTGQIALLLFHRMTPYTNTLAYILPTTAFTFGALFVLRRHLVVGSGFRTRAVLLLNYGVRVAGTDLLTTLSAQVDQSLVVGLLSATNFGLYAVSLNLTRLLNVIQTSINTVLFPRASSLTASEALPLIERVARISLALTFVGAIFFSILVPYLIPVLYGSVYGSVVAITRILVIEAVLQGALSVLSQSFMATGRPGVMTTLQLAGVATSIPLMFVLIPRFGLLGAALALLASTIVRSILLLLSFPIVLKVPIPKVLITRDDVTSLIRRLKPPVSNRDSHSD